MKAAVTTSLIALGLAFVVVGTANAAHEESHESSADATVPKIKTKAITGPDGRSRTPTQHEYWFARHPKERERMGPSPRTDEHVLRDEGQTSQPGLRPANTHGFQLRSATLPLKRTSHCLSASCGNEKTETQEI